MSPALKADNPVHTYVTGPVADALDEAAQAEGLTRPRSYAGPSSPISPAVHAPRKASPARSPTPRCSRVARLLEEAGRA